MKRIAPGQPAKEIQPETNLQFLEISIAALGNCDGNVQSIAKIHQDMEFGGHLSWLLHTGLGCGTRLSVKFTFSFALMSDTLVKLLKLLIKSFSCFCTIVICLP